MTELNNKMLCIKTDKGCFISDCFVTSGYDFEYHNTVIDKLLFNGKKAAKTFHKNWYYIEQYPNLIQREINNERINKRYELLDKTLVSDKIPKIIPYETREEYNLNLLNSLYEYKYDIKPVHLEEIMYDIQVLCEIENYNFPPTFNYTGIKKEGFSDCKYIIKNSDIQHQLLDKIIFPPIMLHEKPCKLSSKQMYDITRQYIIDNIDQSVARITSNYDFCFEVCKIIPVIEPKIITYHNIFAKTKRERDKIHSHIKKYEEYTIFNMTDDRQQYKGYSVIPEMYANNETELKEKLDTWLESLIKLINKPLCQCPECKGKGYINDISKIDFDYS